MCKVSDAWAGNNMIPQTGVCEQVFAASLAAHASKEATPEVCGTLLYAVNGTNVTVGTIMTALGQYCCTSGPSWACGLPFDENPCGLEDDFLANEPSGPPHCSERPHLAETACRSQGFSWRTIPCWEFALLLFATFPDCNATMFPGQMGANFRSSFALHLAPVCCSSGLPSQKCGSLDTRYEAMNPCLNASAYTPDKMSPTFNARCGLVVSDVGANHRKAICEFDNATCAEQLHAQVPPVSAVLQDLARDCCEDKAATTACSSPGSVTCPAPPALPVAQEVKGNLTLTVANAAEFVASAEAKAAVKTSITSLTKVPESRVDVNLSLASRRLAEPGGRRLQAGGVQVDYALRTNSAAAARAEAALSAGAAADSLKTAIIYNLGSTASQMVVTTTAQPTQASTTQANTTAQETSTTQAGSSGSEEEADAAFRPGAMLTVLGAALWVLLC